MKNSLFKSLIALVLIGLGIVMLLVNLNVLTFDLDRWWPYAYAIFFIVLGVHWLIKAFKGFNGFSVPIFLVVFGSALVAGEIGYIRFGFLDVYKLWPLLLIFLGFGALGFTKRYKKRYHHKNMNNYRFHQTDADLGETTFKGSWNVKPIQIWQAVGEHHYDFTKAVMPNENIPITIEGLAGEVYFIMPKDLAFKAEVDVKAGEIHVADQRTEGVNRKLSYESSDFGDAEQKLTINIKLKAGSVRIEQVS